MKKKFLIILTLITLVFTVTMVCPEAKTIRRYTTTADDQKVEDPVDGQKIPGAADGDKEKVNCGAIFTPEAIDIIQELLGYFRVLAPAVLIVMIGTDVISIVMNSDRMPGGKDDSVRRATQKIFRRTVAAVMLFFVPTIIKVVLNLDGVRDTLVMDDSCITIVGVSKD